MIEALQEILGSCDVAVCLLDEDCRIKTCNGAMARLADMAPDRLAGLTCCQALHGAAEQRPVSCPLSRMRISGKPERGMVRMGERDFEVGVDPFFDASGRIVNVLHTVRDAALRSGARQSLMRLQKLEHLGEISSGIAHDLNNILTMAVGMFGLMKDGDGAAMSPSVIGGIQSAMDRAARLCRQLTSVVAGRPSSKTVVSLSSVIEESATLALMGSDHKLLCDVDDDLWLCLAQEEQIAQVVMNLVINARQASDPGRPIRVEARNTRESVGHLGFGEYVKILVRDTGSGIAPGHLENVFTPFFTTKENGTGLGLATVDSIVKEHMGHVTVDSEAGRGTTFTVYLPAADPALAGMNGRTELHCHMGRQGPWIGWSSALG